MKKKDIRELSTRTKEELLKQLVEKYDKMRKEKLELVSGKSKNTAIMKTFKKDIARIKTFLGQKEAGA